MKIRDRLFIRLSLICILGILITDLITYTVVMTYQHRFILEDSARELLPIAKTVHDLYIRYHFNEIEEDTFHQLVSHDYITQDKLVVLIHRDGNIRCVENNFDGHFDADLYFADKLSHILATFEADETFTEIISAKDSDKWPYPAYAGVPITSPEGNFIGGILVVMKSNALQETRRALSGTMVLSLLLASAITGLIVLFFVRKITRSIEALNNSALALASGKLDSHVNVTDRGEIGQLAQSFNIMSQKIQDNIQRLEEMEKIRQTYVANVSHELRTPLNAIRGYAEPLCEKMIQDQNTLNRYHNIILDQTLRLTDLINDLLDLSAIQSKKRLLQKKSVRCDHFLSALVDAFEPDLIQKNIKVKPGAIRS